MRKRKDNIYIGQTTEALDIGVIEPNGINLSLLLTSRFRSELTLGLTRVTASTNR